MDSVRIYKILADEYGDFHIEKHLNIEVSIDDYNGVVTNDLDIPCKLDFVTITDDLDVITYATQSTTQEPEIISNMIEVYKESCNKKISALQERMNRISSLKVL